MLVFNTLDDVLNSDINMNIKLYLSNFIQNILKSYGEASLKKVGSVFFIDKNDFEKLFPDGVKIIWEYAEIVNIKNTVNELVSIIHGVVVRNNDFAIDVFVPMVSPEHHLKTEMLSNVDGTIDFIV